MLYDTFELEELLQKLNGSYDPNDLVNLTEIEKVLDRLRASAILHMNSRRSESFEYRKDYALWAEGLASKLNLDLATYDEEEAMDERLSYYASMALLIREGLISLWHFYVNESRFKIDWNK